LLNQESVTRQRIAELADSGRELIVRYAAELWMLLSE
jgi:hypothetical protein